MGDFNSKVGHEEEFRPVLGNYNLHDVLNDNGVRLISFAASHDMIIGSTFFQRKNIHKTTWRNQIDHILISSRYRTNLLDVKTHRGANLDSNYYSVICKLREKISMVKKARRVDSIRFNCEKLNNPKVRKEFETQLSIEFNVKEDCDELNREWQQVKDSILSTALLGRKNKINKNCKV
ncbi:craniofacial development protein 2-like [Parasteatoda tepidariorum]|uniref:craniofacial development protein 2-like n=1 Tax=Parasteatoda tepidariorum TaxID=114398 RepID=UPI0039BC8C90